MRRHLFPIFLLFAFLLMEVRADDQASSGHGGDGYASSGDDEGSGFNGQEGNFFSFLVSIKAFYVRFQFNQF